MDSQPLSFEPLPPTEENNSLIEQEESSEELKLNADFVINDDFFKILVNTVKDYAIFMLNPEGRVMTWNEGAQRINGYKAEEVIGRHFSIFYTSDSKAEKHPEHELELAIANGRYEEEGMRVRKDGTTFWATVVITTMYDDGKLIGFAKVTRDLTERRAAEREREEYAKQIAESNEELQRLAYVVSHELQAPISTIARYVNLLLARYKDRLGSDADDFLTKIYNSSALIGRMIDDLWTYARIAKPYLEREWVYTDKVLEAALQELKDMIGENEVSSNQLPALQGNKQQLVSLFKQLIKNAIMYRGNDAPKVRIEATPIDNGWQFAVHDNGVGIDMVRSSEVFVLFHRLTGGPEASATGMGLAMCKKIVQQHSGRIWFESTPGRGSTFYFWLPER